MNRKNEDDMVTFQQVFDAANNASHYLNLLGYDINSRQNCIAFGIRKAADKFIFEAGSTETLGYVYDPETDDQWANEMQQIIVGVIAEYNKNNFIAFKYIFEQLTKYGDWLHPNEKMPEDEVVEDLFAEIAGSIISLNSNMPYTWINEHSSTHTQIGALAYAARAIRKNTQ